MNKLIWRQNELTADVLFAFKPGSELRGNTKLSKRPSKELKDICARLLGVGGNMVICYISEDSPFWFLLPVVRNFGGLMTPERVKMKRGEPSRCLDNSFQLAQSNPQKYTPAIGWGLSDDGLWRPHAWCVNSKEGKIITETTVARDKYYGVAMLGVTRG